ncbi:hypothetical protein C8R47DRAFT_1319168 [Mycena vitilis]|nr:hypothetical protein C8R47DRAFT_1319168 [Mycena vitilis]
MTSLVKDVLALVYTLRYQSAAGVVGHNFGSSVAAYCALIRPDVFRSAVLISAPFAGPPKLTLGGGSALPLLDKISGAFANADLMNAPGGLRAFMREYYHVKSADWEGNNPHELAPEASAMAELPHYYMMPLHKTMPEAVHGFGPSAEEIARNMWLTEEELGVYVAEYSRTGFHSGLNACRMSRKVVF